MTIDPSAPPPHFLIIGAMKAGTTSLFELLGAHPQVSPPRNKEPHFFTANRRLPRRYYRWLFRNTGDGMLTGEASPSYAWVQRYPDVAPRIRAMAPAVRLILVIREPVARVVSHARHEVLLGKAPVSAASLAARDDLWELCDYRATIEHYLEHFDDSQLLVCDLEDLAASAHEVDRVLGFLGLHRPAAFPANFPRSFSSAERLAMPSFVGSLATTTAGAVVRDLVPQRQLHRVKRLVARRESAQRSSDPLTPDEVRAAAEARCRVATDAYQWAREYIDRHR